MMMVSMTFKMTLVSGVLALAACGEAVPPSPETQSFIATFGGAPDGACRIDAPDGVVTTSRFLGTDNATVRGGIATSTLICATPSGDVQTISHRNLFNANVSRVNALGSGATGPGPRPVLGASSQTRGEFEYRATFIWTRR